MTPHFDWTINLGNMISIAVFILTLFKFQGNIVRELAEIRIKLNFVWDRFVKETEFDLEQKRTREMHLRRRITDR